jgi:hypothetical protein
MHSRGKFVVRLFSILITIIHIALAFLCCFFAWENVFAKIHISIAVVFALSGLLMCYDTTSVNTYLFFVSGTLSWYGVLYCYISSETSLEIHHYIQPEMVIAFLTYAGTLLTFSEIQGFKNNLRSFKYNSPGIALLILYLWSKELFYENDNDLFLKNAMKRLSPQFSLFSDQRISYLLILISCHYCNIIFLWFFIDNSITETKFDRPDYNMDILREKLDLKRNQIKNSATISINKIKNVTNTKDLQKEYKNIVQSESEFLEDCIEISEEDAFLLTGDDYSMVDSYHHSDKHHGV